MTQDLPWLYTLIKFGPVACWPVGSGQASVTATWPLAILRIDMNPPQGQLIIWGLFSKLGFRRLPPPCSLPLDFALLLCYPEFRLSNSQAKKLAHLASFSAKPGVSNLNLDESSFLSLPNRLPLRIAYQPVKEWLPRVANIPKNHRLRHSPFPTLPLPQPGTARSIKTPSHKLSFTIEIIREF